MSLVIGDRSAGRDNNFNLLRMIAATGVLVSHAYPISLGPDAVQPLETALKGTVLGTVCVMVFFAIAGFFITRSFDRKHSFRAFLAARLLRLFPALLVVLLVTVLVAGFFLTVAPPSEFWAEAGHYVLRNLSLFNLQYTLPGVFEANPSGAGINGSLWTLSYEVLCYGGVVVAGFAGLFARRTHFALAAAAFLGLYLAALFFDLHSRIEALSLLGLPFVTGMTFYLWREAIPLSPLLLAAGCAMTVLAWFTPLFLPVFTVTLSYATFLLGYADSPLLRRYNAFGDYSYGMYVYAFPIQQLVAAQGVVSPLANMMLAGVGALVCAVLSWHLVEAPALRLRHRVARPGVGQANPAPGPR